MQTYLNQRRTWRLGLLAAAALALAGCASVAPSPALATSAPPAEPAAAPARAIVFASPVVASATALQTITLAPSGTSLPTGTRMPSLTPPPTAALQAGAKEPARSGGTSQPAASQTAVGEAPTASPGISCGVTPARVPALTNTPITFWVKYTPPTPGLLFTIIRFDFQYPGTAGCVAASDPQGQASCKGFSGRLPAGKVIHVTISTSAGLCYAEYGTQ